ncbi:MAG: hypothetical protein ACRDPM_07125 [Solirubrobacteraceae bacterium]
MTRPGPVPLAPAHDGELTVTLRYAVFDDAPDLLRLAQLDSAEPLSEPILVAEVSGRLTAALALAEDRVIADPFMLTTSAVELLRARARQLSGTGRRGRRGGRVRGLRALRRASAL